MDRHLRLGWAGLLQRQEIGGNRTKYLIPYTK
jgi:hypothetical protein